MKRFLLFAAIAGIVLAGCDDDSKKDEPTTPNPPNPTTAPVITIGTHPATTTNVTAGSITGTLTVAATATPSATLSYQWYSNTTASNVGGTSLGTSATGAQTNSLTIPTGLAAGSHYYFCAVSATGAEAKRSNAATVTVAAAGGGGGIDSKLVGDWRCHTMRYVAVGNLQLVWINYEFKANGNFVLFYASTRMEGKYSTSGGKISLTNLIGYNTSDGSTPSFEITDSKGQPLQIVMEYEIGVKNGFDYLKIPDAETRGRAVYYENRLVDISVADWFMRTKDEYQFPN